MTALPGSGSSTRRWRPHWWPSRWPRSWASAAFEPRPRPARPGRHRLPQRPPPALRRLDRLRHGRSLHRRRADGYGEDPDYFGRSQRLGGLLLDRGFGLAAWMPAYLLAVPALAALARRRPAGCGGPWWRRSRPVGPRRRGWPSPCTAGGGPAARWWSWFPCLVLAVVVGRPGANGPSSWWQGCSGAGLGLAGGRGARSPAPHADFRLRVDGQPVVSGVAPALPDYRQLLGTGSSFRRPGSWRWPGCRVGVTCFPLSQLRCGRSGFGA